MTDVREILPAIGNKQPWEQAIAHGMSDELPVPYDQIMDPDTTPEAFLPILAAHNGVQLWYPDWPVERKRKIIKEWPMLAKLIGTRAAAQAFLDYVDAEIIDKASYPAVPPIGKIALGIHPWRFKPYVARYLVKVTLVAPVNAFCVGRSAVGRSVVRPPSDEPIRRALEALLVSKSPATEYGVMFSWRVPQTLDDVLDLDGEGYVLGSYRDRHRI